MTASSLTWPTSIPANGGRRELAAARAWPPWIAMSCGSAPSSCFIPRDAGRASPSTRPSSWLGATARRIAGVRQRRAGPLAPRAPSTGPEPKHACAPTIYRPVSALAAARARTAAPICTSTHVQRWRLHAGPGRRSCRRSGLSAVAITDHDTLAGIAAATRPAAGERELEVISGVEITAEFRRKRAAPARLFLRSRTIGHLNAALDSLRSERVGRFPGWSSDWPKLWASILIEAAAEPRGWTRWAGGIWRRCSCRRGRRRSVREAFQRATSAIGGRAAVPKRRLPVADAMALVRGSRRRGGVGASDLEIATRETLRRTARASASARLEVDFPACRPGRRARVAALGGRDAGLAVTGGSDCHGPGDPPRHVSASGGVSPCATDDASSHHGQRWWMPGEVPPPVAEPLQGLSIIQWYSAPIFDKIKQGLAKTRSLFSGVAALFRLQGQGRSGVPRRTGKAPLPRRRRHRRHARDRRRVRQAFLDKEITGEMLDVRQGAAHATC